MSAGPLDQGAVRRRIRGGGITSGCFAGMASPMAVEVMAAAGVDWVVLDLEHGGGGEEQVGPAVVAAGAYGASVLVRVETPERLRIGRVLDAGAAGVMIPRVESAEQVRSIMRHLRYPPRGDRGVATYNRSIRWGLDKEALAQADDRVTTIVQIETLQALAEADEIAAIDGVDVLFVGPLDLSYAVGHPVDFEAPEFTEALARVLAAAERHQVAAGILCPGPEVAARRRREGFRFLAVGSDSTLLAAATSAAMAQAREGSPAAG
ncbi:2,4-dihydroxyhept-2-ene-1,7-dioic acid aldolase [Kocuria coralli]|uniref:2,4-dihydroxyhept-2-ene-1,7-dioic acid aldolase n=1 Tax=Kocuria coralli TaxID=1461025 RepID=A0A5J5KXJ2_9MICC|nr:aldolase/citrate lyase family protein [Kocuria coralli]KAA9394393.1 2,4-dihydroxyhept-2-ene-1,7-dioic acid aldolase [Kocuria coralli]